MLRRYSCLAVLTLASVMVVGLGRAANPSAEPIRIGMLTTMFRSGKPAWATALKGPLSAVVNAQTGFDCKVDMLADPDELREQLADGKIQFALSHGFEFAWMLEDDPRLKAIMIAAPVNRPLKAYVVVASTNPAKDLDDLKGTTVALPNGIHETARMFARHKCDCAADKPSQLFEKVTTPVNAETALHEVFENKVQAAIVDQSGWRCLADRYPARFQRVRVLKESEPFPMTVVSVRDGTVDAAIVRRFADGMGRAHQTAMGRQILALMQSSGFQTPPSDYDEQIAAIIKRYPAQGADSRK
jgi:ABC-type phosphate/phosphonate transport system substrate-binding protein